MKYFIIAAVLAYVVYRIFKVKRSWQTSKPAYLEGDDNYQVEYSPPATQQYWDDCQDIPVRASLRLSYRNRHGEASERTVEVSRYNGSCYLPAYCDLRKEYRTFRIDRIQQCIDTETGEVIRHVPDYLLKKYRESPEFSMIKAFEKGFDIISVLFYVGKADGALRAGEREIICQAVRAITKDDRITVEMLNRELDAIPLPTMQSFKMAVGRICKASPEKMVLTYKLAQKIIGTQKKVHANETSALEYMVARMKREKVETT